ncbi:MAG: hypothetical protein N4Q30_06940 [Neisseriaceae bacterium]|nr:hypothetical protein [Neisseriaceae bacterium]
MLNDIKWPILLLAATPVFSFADNSPIPNKVSIDFAGPGGSVSKINFKKTGNQYNISYSFDVPFYKIVYQSNGTVSNHHLSTNKFTDSRNGSVVSSATFNHANNTVRYGKIGKQQTTQINGHSYDTISLPWEMSFNPDLVLNTFQITTGKKVYLMQAGNTPISSIKKIRKISTPKGTIKTDIYDLELIKGSQTAIQFGYSKQYQNLPVYIKFKNSIYDVEFVATSIVVDGKKIL